MSKHARETGAFSRPYLVYHNEKAFVWLRRQRRQRTEVVAFDEEIEEMRRENASKRGCWCEFCFSDERKSHE